MHLPILSWMFLLAVCLYALFLLADLALRQAVGCLVVGSLLVLVPWTIVAAYRSGKRRGVVAGLQRASRLADCPDHPPVDASAQRWHVAD